MCDVPAGTLPVIRTRTMLNGQNQIWFSHEGRKLHVTGFVLTAYNEEGKKGQVSIRDGGEGGEIIWQFNLPPKALIDNPPSLVVPMAFSPPVVFSEDMWLMGDAGSVTWNVQLSGYEV